MAWRHLRMRVRHASPEHSLPPQREPNPRESSRGEAPAC
jgi:hypothetical protein